MSSRWLLRLASLMLALGWMAFIYWQSSGPITLDIPELFPHEDKLLHAVAFGLLAMFWLGTFPIAEAGYRRRHVLWAIVLATLYGAFDEWHQSFVPGRTTDAADLLADAIGAALFAGLMARVVRMRRKAPLRSG